METTEKNNNKGRPIGTGKLNQEVVDRVCAGIRVGMSFKSAAIQAGVHRCTFDRWLKKGENAKTGIYRIFCDQMGKAVEDAKAFHLKNIHICAQGEEYTEITEKIDPETNMVIERTIARKRTKRDPSCSKWILERRFPEEFGPRLELKGDMVTEVHIVAYDEEETALIDAMNASIMDPPEDNDTP